MNQIKYVIIKAKLINILDFELRRGKYKVYLTSEEGIRYNKNKFFFQTKKGIVKFKGHAPKELEGCKTHTSSELRKIISSSWGQWKLN